MGKVAQQVDLVRKEPANLHFGAIPLSAVANLPAAHKAGRALLRPQLPGLSSTLRAIIDNVPGRVQPPILTRSRASLIGFRSTTY